MACPKSRRCAPDPGAPEGNSMPGRALIPNLLERALFIRSNRIAATRAYGRNDSATLAVLKINRSDRILRPTPTSAATQPRGKEPSVHCSFGSVSRMLPSVRMVFMTATASSGSLLRFASVSLRPCRVRHAGAPRCEAGGGSLRWGAALRIIRVQTFGLCFGEALHGDGKSAEPRPRP